MWIDLSKWAKDVKIFVSHVNAHQKVTSAEEEFNNQVDKMTRSVDNQPLSPAIPVIAQWAHEQSGHGGLQSEFQGNGTKEKARTEEGAVGMISQSKVRMNISQLLVC
jgi:hypothetical protein